MTAEQTKKAIGTFVLGVAVIVAAYALIEWVLKPMANKKATTDNIAAPDQTTQG